MRFLVKLVLLYFTSLIHSLASLEHDMEKCVIIVDFTKWGLVVNGNVHCFVVCVLFGVKDEKKKKSKDEYCGMLNYFCLYLILRYSVETYD